MEEKDLKYRRVMDVLKASKPSLETTEDIEAGAWARILAPGKPAVSHSGMMDYLFTWAYIPWIRRSLIAAAFTMLTVFLLQQGIIMREIGQINRRIDTVGKDAPLRTTIYQEHSIVSRFREKRLGLGKTNLTDQKIDELLRSIDNLKKEYIDIQKIIEADPELKKLVEEKLSEINGKQVKL